MWNKVHPIKFNTNWLMLRLSISKLHLKFKNSSCRKFFDRRLSKAEVFFLTHASVWPHYSILIPLTLEVVKVLLPSNTGWKHISCPILVVKFIISAIIILFYSVFHSTYDSWAKQSFSVSVLRNIARSLE